MLTGDLVRSRLRKQGASLHIDMLEVDSAHWQRAATDLITLFQTHVGRAQCDWEASLEGYEGERMDYVVLRGLAKVLADGATFAHPDTPCPPVQIRERLFARGPVFAKLDLFHRQTREEALRGVGTELDLTPEAIQAMLFADRPLEYLLTEAGPAWTPDMLLARYNLELARGALYWASELQVELHDTFKDFWRYVKLFKLMFEARMNEPSGYHVALDGPISPFVASTTRYGRQLAAFLPALFLCERWSMAAAVRLPSSGETLTYRLDSTSPLRSHFQRSGVFDSILEADFAAEFEAKFGGERGKWTLSREDEALLLGDTVMIPDFALTHKRDGRRALVEIVGFWHPDYLRRKVEKVRAANRRDLILLVYEGVNLSAEKLQAVPGEVLYFANKPVLKDVMTAVENCAI